MPTRSLKAVQPIGMPSQQLHDLGYYAWITPAQAIDHLGINSRSALQRLMDHGLPFGRIGRRLRFRRDHLDEWVLRRGVDALNVAKSA